MDLDVHELLEQLARTPEILSGKITGLPAGELRQKKSAADFSVIENVCHLRDLEVEGYAVRIDRILNEDEPDLADFDGGKIAAERDYNSEDLDSALGAFVRARNQNIEWMRKIEREKFDRTAMLEGVGRITLRDLLVLMREHDDGHLQTLI